MDQKKLENYFDRLWPIGRSITGQGYRESLDILSELMPNKRLSFKTGRQVFDWTVPREWVIRDAYLIGPDGKKRAEFKKNNLHLVGYSTPFKGKLSLEELKPHLYSLPAQPDAIPYVTSYYNERWCFCLSHNELTALPQGQYEVFVDSEFINGSVEVAEAVLQGETKEEILFSSYLCHPSMANDDLSGPLALAFLYQKVAALSKRRYTYRFALMPETIGAICYLTERGDLFKKQLAAGFEMTCLADAGSFTYKKSRKGNSLADRAAAAVLKQHGQHEILKFDPCRGSDERQYCSPGFDLPVGSLMRTMYGRYPQYHTSLDNKEFISFSALAGSIDTYFELVQALEANVVWKNTVMYCEPQLGKRGLYAELGGQKLVENKISATLWFLNLADGTRDLLAIAEESGQPVALMIELAQVLSKAGLLKRA